MSPSDLNNNSHFSLPQLRWGSEQSECLFSSLLLLIGSVKKTDLEVFLCGMSLCWCVCGLHSLCCLDTQYLASTARYSTLIISHSPRTAWLLHQARIWTAAAKIDVDFRRYIRNPQVPSPQWFVYVKVGIWGAKRFCHLHSSVRFSVKLLPRMRLNQAHSSNFFPSGCLFVGLCWHANKWGSARPQVQQWLDQRKVTSPCCVCCRVGD